MLSKLCCLLWSLAALVVVQCEPPVPNSSYGTPLAPPLNSYTTPNEDDHHHDHHEYGEPKSYEFGYQVIDDYTGNNYNRKEASDGNQVRGEYRVQLPDGRTQIVTYWADWQSGFHADVRYEGTAQYPDQHATGNGNYNNNNNNGGPYNQYGPPINHNTNNNGYYNNNGPAKSSVSIKDYSGDAHPYNAEHINNGFNNNNNNGGYNYDRPSFGYGTL